MDDEPVHLKALCRALRDRDFVITSFSSPTAALAELEKNEFELLLSDLMMPEMNGIALLDAALKLRPDLVGVIMTGEGTINTAVEAMRTGAMDYVLKPFKIEGILPVLERALSVRELRLKNLALEKRIQERTAQLEAANKELEAFSYSVSHDLRAPLRHISGFSNMLAKSLGPEVPDPAQRYLDLITKASTQMNQLIDDLLEFSRMSRTELRRQRVDIGGLVEDVIHSIQPELEGRNIVWKKNTLPVIQADLAMLRQVFSNLLLNAIKYSRMRNPAEIEIGAQENGATEHVIYVRENGVGFDMRYASKLFGVFSRLHRQDEFEGSGIGLANVRRIVSRHGGRTWAEGEIDRGATFYFSLPR